MRVLLASASAVRRAGLESIITSNKSLKLAAVLQGTHTISKRAAESQTDVILADLDGESSLPLTEEFPFPLVALIDAPDPAWVALALRSGIKAILPREAGADEIIPAIFAAYSGRVLLDSTVALELAKRVQVRAPANDLPEEHLTARELEVLAMLAEGLGNREIAGRLGVSDHTIKFHISSILDKLGASTRTEAVTIGLRMGLILL